MYESGRMQNKQTVSIDWPSIAAVFLDQQFFSSKNIFFTFHKKKEIVSMLECSSRQIFHFLFSSFRANLQK
jgi:hypothetical protein